MADELEITDARVHFLADYLLKSLRLRSDKWTKMVQIEDQNRTVLDFCDKPQPLLLIFHVNPAGNLVRRLASIIIHHPSLLGRRNFVLVVVEEQSLFLRQKVARTIDTRVQREDSLVVELWGPFQYCPRSTADLHQ